MSIINIELMLWMRYKVDPFSMLRDVTVNDLMFYTETLTNRLEDEQKNKVQDRLMQSLVQIRDILNYMTFSQVSNN